ncbi:MAG: hypothetical protein AB7O45_02890 [Alphaproteobacteria bacterium]
MIARLAVAGLMAILAAPAPAQGPRAIVDALRATPANLYELSVARLEAYLASIGSTHGFRAFANFQDGKLVIFVSAEEQDASEPICRMIVSLVKQAADVDPATGEPYRPASVVASFFN